MLALVRYPLNKMEVARDAFIERFCGRWSPLFRSHGMRIRACNKRGDGRILRRGESVFVFPEEPLLQMMAFAIFSLARSKPLWPLACRLFQSRLPATRKLLRDGTYLRGNQRDHHFISPIYPRQESVARHGGESSDWHDLIRLRDETRTAIARHVSEALL